LTVEISEDAESVVVNGQKVDDYPVDFITNADFRAICLADHVGVKPASGFSVTASNGAVYVKCSKELDQMVFVKLYSVTGGTRPLIQEKQTEGVITPDDKTITLDAKKSVDSIYLVTLTAGNGEFLDFRWVRGQN
jgi:hypothetical protein